MEVPLKKGTRYVGHTSVVGFFVCRHLLDTFSPTGVRSALLPFASIWRGLFVGLANHFLVPPQASVLPALAFRLASVNKIVELL